MRAADMNTYFPDGEFRIVVTRPLPGDRWLSILEQAGCRVDVCSGPTRYDNTAIKAVMGDVCHGVIGQLTERWDEVLLQALARAGGRVYSNYAVGYNNVDVSAATRRRIPVGNTPGVLTETTAEMAVALTFAAARRVGEAERYMRAGLYQGWLPTLFMGTMLRGATLGVIGAGRIGGAYARMMIQGHGMNLIYFNRHGSPALEAFVADYNRFLDYRGEKPVFCRRAGTLEQLLRHADCVSIHTIYDRSTHHMLDARGLKLMKPNAILVNTSRGSVIDETALVDHCRAYPDFRAGLDVFENEPEMAPGLKDLDNVVLVPHIASATRWTREGMAALAAGNIAGILKGLPIWPRTDMEPFLTTPEPPATPSIVNARELGLPFYRS